jgi:hypothetical protein
MMKFSDKRNYLTKNHSVNRITRCLLSPNIIFYLLFIILSCSKDQQIVILDRDYLFVADILQYCQGDCDKTDDWENKTAKVKGCIKDIESDAKMDEYYSKGKFSLEDIRNGMYLEVRVSDNKDDIFEKIGNASKTDYIFIDGILNAVYGTGDDGCEKGVIVIVSHPDNITME